MTVRRVDMAVEQSERRSESSRVQRFLAEAGDVLAASLDLSETLQSTVRLCVPTLAGWSLVRLLPDGASDVRFAAAHVNPMLEPLLRDAGRDYPIPACFNDCATGRARPTVIQDIDDLPRAPLLHQLGTTAILIVPMTIRNVQLGHLVLGSTEPDATFSGADIAIVDDLARRSAVAIENARLYQDAREAEARVRQQAARLEALAEASQAFAMARLDLDAVLHTVTRRVAELVGDVCSIRLVSPDGQYMIPVAFHHTNPESFEMFRTLRSFGPRHIFSGTVGQVMQTGEPLLIAHKSVEEWRSIILPDWVPYVEKFRMHSVLIVPLRAGGTTIGTLGLWRESTPEAFTLDDLQFVQDLADRAALAVDNARLYEDAQAAIAARDEFLSVAAHELKTPVTSLRGYAQLLLRHINKTGEVPAVRLASALSSIDRQTWRLSALISQLLDTSRIQSGELAIQPSDTDIIQLIEELIEHAQTLSELHDIQVNVSRPLMAQVDGIRLEQVLTNLLENAIKYSPDGGSVVIEARTIDNARLRISVLDSGPGIAESERSRIFERFYQLPGRERTSGIGLGLYISRQIVTLHGGTICVECPDGGGTRFVIELPLTR